MRQALTLALSLAFTFSTIAGENELKVKVPAIEITDKAFDPAAVVASADGKTLIFSANPSSRTMGEPRSLFTAEKQADGSWNAELARRGNVFRLWSSGSYSDDGELIITGHEDYRPGALTRSLLTLLSPEGGEIRGYKHFISAYDRETGELVWRKNAKDLGIEKGDRMNHARLSPNGQWLAFYLRKKQQQRGVWIHHLASGKSVRLGDFDDKHPTWSPDGSRLWFHSQRGGNAFIESETEEASIGYYSLSFNGDKALVNERVVLDDTAKDDYVYLKHPAEIPGTNLVMFHFKKKEGGSSKLGIRKIAVGSTIQELDIKDRNGLKLKKAKHPTVPAHTANEFFFVGKAEDENGENLDWKLYSLPMNKVLELVQ